jgi:hypothetical protein
MKKRRNQKRNWYEILTKYLPDPEGYFNFSICWKNEQEDRYVSIKSILKDRTVIWDLGNSKEENFESVLCVEQDFPGDNEAEFIALLLSKWLNKRLSSTAVKREYKKNLKGENGKYAGK